MLILVCFITLLIIAAVGAVVYFALKKVKPKRNDLTEKSDLTNAQDFLPFDDIKNDMIIIEDHQYRAVLECSSTNYQLKTEEERDLIELSFHRFLNSIEFPFTFFLQTKVIDNTARYKQLEADAAETMAVFPEIKNYAERYLADMRDLNTKIGNAQQKKRHIIVTYDDAVELVALNEAEKRIYAEKELKNRCNIIRKGLESVGITATQLRTEDLIELVYSSYYRDDYSYAEHIASGEALPLIVHGEKDNFKNLPKTALLDVVLKEAINQIDLGNLDSDPSGEKIREQLTQLRENYAGHFLSED